MIIDKQGTLDNCRVALVCSRFNLSISELLFEGAMTRLQELNFEEHQVTAVWVPGAIEIPVAAQRLASKQAYEAIICLGAVIRGETSHYDYVCDQVSMGCTQVSLAHDIPVLFGILTTDNETQARARLGGVHGHKGRECVDAALEMVAVLREIDEV